ncbi:MAG: GNAT family N-acetyltransferase [Caldilineaceae bacterium]|nr:GNAT family N-acetyltransferase [Caldilineaceae bacterium]
MIRPLREAARSAAVALLRAAPYLNLYLLGNIESLGFDQPFCEFWGDFDGPVLRAMVNRYMQGWSVYGNADADWAGLAAVVDGHPVDAERLQDNPGGIPSFLPYLRRYEAFKVEEQQVMDLAEADFRPRPAPEGVRVRRASLTDLGALALFYSDAGSMSRSPLGVERPLRDTRLWLAEADGKADGEVLSAALTNAETRDLAMIGGVYTPPQWRNRGLSQVVCSALCADLLATGKRPVLYWHNPSAGRVYARLGFRLRGVWRSARLHRHGAGGAAYPAED